MENLQYLQAFLDESLENIQALNTLCLKIEQGHPEDDDFAAMFRAAHTLKGMSATMGYANMAKLTHKLEDALGHLREHPTRLGEAIVDAVFGCIDALEGELQSIRSTNVESGSRYDELIQRLDGFIRGEVLSAVQEVAVASTLPSQQFVFDSTVDNMVSQCRDMGLTVGVIRVHIDETCQMKGPRAIMVSRALESCGHCLQCVPTAEILESGAFSDSVLYFLMALETEVAQCTTAIENITEITQAVFIPIDEWKQGVHPPSRDSQVQHADVAAKTERVERVEKLDRTIRVPVERLDSLMNMLSELVIDKTRLASIARTTEQTELKELSDHMSRVANDLQAAVMSLRMVPVDMLFQRFPRMVRDLAKTLEKDIRLDMSGLETEFDRTIIDEMGEVLVHLIRNSADHGLEDTQQRLNLGKPASGTISLKAYSSGQHVFIEVCDDGAGINVDKVRNRAIERGLISESAAQSLSASQVYALLFESGFSTADTISDISGRGVGLDAVRRKVESLGGIIEIESEPGSGSVFRIQLPLTVSILQALLVQVHGETYALPLGSVQEVVNVTHDVLKKVHGESVLQSGDSLVPILDGRAWLSSHKLQMGSQSSDSELNIVIVKEGSKKLAFTVDEFIGQYEIVHKSLGKYLENVPWFAGATILGDGGIALILDVHAMMSQLS